MEFLPEEQATRQESGRWVGPIQSGYGSHLVNMEEVLPGDLPPPERIRSQVERESRAAQGHQREEVLDRKLLGTYTISRPVIPPGLPQPHPTACRTAGRH